MDYNIITEYTTFIKKELLEFYKIALDKVYVKSLIDPFLNKYINVRYYNESMHLNIKDNVERIGKDLEDTYNLLQTKEKEEALKNIYSLFGYIIYFDDLVSIDEETNLIDIFFEDENIKIEKDKTKKTKLNNWYRIFKKRKRAFMELFETNKFSVSYDKIKTNLYSVNLDHDVPISYLYSEIAIDKAFHSDIVTESAIQITLVMCSYQILENALNEEFKECYMINFPDSLWGKNKKCERFFKYVNNTLALKQLVFSISYSVYLENSTKIKKLIQNGYRFAIIIDDSYDGKTNELLLFSYIMINRKSDYLDYIMNDDSLVGIPIIKTR